jgi:pilus assembly protein Flp/PilA
MNDDRGATAVEYGMIVALIAAIIVLTVQAVGLDVLGGFQDVDNAIP